MFEILSLLGRITGIIVAGGYACSVVDFLTGDLGSISLPNLPKGLHNSSMVAHNGTILLCGGLDNLDKCLQFDYGTWKKHSSLNKKRARHSAVTTKTATFVFGGDKYHSDNTYEYLVEDSTKWLIGKTKIPGGFDYGCAIAVKSDQEIWLIGGTGTEKRILSFNINDHTFKVMPFQLNLARQGHSCAFIPNTNKIMVTGGHGNTGYLDSAEILDTEDGSVSKASSMNSKRDCHGMGIITINEKDRLAAFGGYDGTNTLRSVELYNTQTGKWETSDFKLSRAK